MLINSFLWNYIPNKLNNNSNINNNKTWFGQIHIKIHSISITN